MLAGNPALKALWTARVVSKLGDWAARIALITLVYTSTGSALWAGAATAACYAPFLGPGQLLATYADRLPHRTVLVVSDLVRLPIFLALALVPMPPAAMVALAFVAAFGDVPSGAAYQAAIPMIAKERYSEALVMFATTAQVTILLGYAGGGVLVTLFGARGVLLLNAVTFLVAALLVMRVPSTRSGGTVTKARTHLRESVRIVTADRLVAIALAVVAVSCLGQMGIESLTVVYADHLGFGTGIGAGLLYTAMPLAAIVTGFFLPSWTDPLRLVRLVVAANVISVRRLDRRVPASRWDACRHRRRGRTRCARHDGHAAVRGGRGPDPGQPPSHRLRVLHGLLHGDAAGGALFAGVLTELVGVQAAFALACAPTVLVGACTWRLLQPQPKPAAAKAEPELVAFPVGCVVRPKRGWPRRAPGGRHGVRRPRRPRCRPPGWPARAGARRGSRPASAACGSRRRGWRRRRRAGCRTACRTTRRAAAPPCSSEAKIEPPSSLTTTIVRSGRSSSGPSTRPLASCRNVTSPSSASDRVLCGRPSAAPMALDTEPSMPARPRLPTTIRRSPTAYGATIRSRSRTGLEAPTNSSPPGGSAGADRPGDLVRRQRAAAAEQRVEAPGHVGVPGRATPAAHGSGSRGCRRRPGLAGEPRRVDALELDPVDDDVHVVAGVGPARGAAHGVQLDVVAGQQPPHRPRQRRVPEHHDLLDAGRPASGSESSSR